MLFDLYITGGVCEYWFCSAYQPNLKHFIAMRIQNDSIKTQIDNPIHLLHVMIMHDIYFMDNQTISDIIIAILSFLL